MTKSENLCSMFNDPLDTSLIAYIITNNMQHGGKFIVELLDTCDRDDLYSFIGIIYSREELREQFRKKLSEYYDCARSDDEGKHDSMMNCMEENLFTFSEKVSGKYNIANLLKHIKTNMESYYKDRQALSQNLPNIEKWGLFYEKTNIVGYYTIIQVNEEEKDNNKKIASFLNSSLYGELTKGNISITNLQYSNLYFGTGDQIILLNHDKYTVHDSKSDNIFKKNRHYDKYQLYKNYGYTYYPINYTPGQILISFDEKAWNAAPCIEILLTLCGVGKENMRKFIYNNPHNEKRLSKFVRNMTNSSDIKKKINGLVGAAIIKVGGNISYYQKYIKYKKKYMSTQNNK